MLESLKDFLNVVRFDECLLAEVDFPDFLKFRI